MYLSLYGKFRKPGSGKSSPGKQSKITVIINQQMPGIKEVNFNFNSTFLKTANYVTIFYRYLIKLYYQS